MIQVKRVYEPAEKDDGARFLVDRLWPRGFKKANLPSGGWLKQVAPSDKLRKWFGALRLYCSAGLPSHACKYASVIAAGCPW